ncbi:MAG: metallophosphoesterase [Candidatus Altiarchaeota archaeon]|nr:metallophosphoesterase [Candidatus Altiarchaeota archaeon]
MIGIMSDSHDDLEGIRMAVEFFNTKKTSLVVHAGDIISPFTFKEFRKLGCSLRGVFGNNDGERKGLNEKFSVLDMEFRDILEMEYDNVKVCVYHGTYEEIVHALVESGRYDVVVRGHNHKAEVWRKEKTLVVNPGEVCGYLTGRKTVALLDLEDLSATIYEV